MNAFRPQRTKLLIMFILLLLVATAVVGQGRSVSAETRGELLTGLNTATDGNLYTNEGQFGTLTFLQATDGVLSVGNTRASAETRARDFLADYGSLFGLDNAYANLSVLETHTDNLGMTHVRFNQMHNDIPVFGGQMIVHLNADGVTAANGNIVPNIAIPQAAITLESAEQIAVQDVAKRDRDAIFTVFEAEQMIYHTGLLQGVNGDVRLAYSIKTASDGPIEHIIVDAASGEVLNVIPLRHGAKYRHVYTPVYAPIAEVGNEDNPPPALIVVPNPTNTDLNFGIGTPPSLLFDFAGHVYDFFYEGFGRESWDGEDAHMHSVYLVNQNCPNAYWNGETTNYCPGFDLDDVVAHEWGHAYTEKTHGLIYQWQSGALNESYSDIWGETIDLHNDIDDSAPLYINDNSQPAPNGVRWILGEGLSSVAVDLLLRDMWDPERLGYPATVSSDNYHCETSDGGGVHTNSGVPNLAYVMLVDGRTFNDITIEPIGFVKASNIYFRASTDYQVNSSDFSDHADALMASCMDLVNSGETLSNSWLGLPDEVMTANDCTQVANAIEAVEMRTEPTQCNFQPLLAQDTPPACGEGLAPNNFFSENWESGTNGATVDSMAGWSIVAEAAPGGDTFDAQEYDWVIKTDLPSERSGTAAFAIDEITGTCAPGGDISGRFYMESPAMTVGAGEDSTISLAFDHWVSTELEFDGGNLLISINDGPFTVVPEANYTFNPPNSTFATDATHQKAGEDAWMGTDGGAIKGTWGTTIVDLAGLGASEGDTVKARWDFAIDGCNGIEGWYVDDVRAYTCTQAAPTAVNLVESHSQETTSSFTWLLAT